MNWHSIVLDLLASSSVVLYDNLISVSVHSTYVAGPIGPFLPMPGQYLAQLELSRFGRPWVMDRSFRTITLQSTILWGGWGEGDDASIEVQLRLSFESC